VSGDVELDLERLREIPDPYAGAPARPQPPLHMPETPSATRATYRRNRMLALLGVALYEAGWLVVVERRADLGALSGRAIAVGLAIPLVAAAIALLPVRTRGRRGLGAPVTTLVALAVLAPLVFGVATLASSPPDPPGDAFWNLALRCMAVSALLTAGPLVLASVAFRHAFAAAPEWRTVGLGVACGAVGAATMSLACIHSGALHVVVGHGATMLLGGVLGGLIGARLTRA
jgi:hypothetical protein